MRRFSLSSLHARLVLLVLFAFAPSAALLLYTNLQARLVATHDSEANTMRLVHLAASHQDRLVAVARQLLATLAQLPEVQRGYGSACGPLFGALLKQYPHYVNLGAIGPQGDLFCSASPTDAATNLSDRAFVQRALLTRDFSVEQYQIDRVTRKATANFAYPAFDAAGRPRAVVFATVDLVWLNQLVAEALLPEQAEVMVLDSSGTVLVHLPDQGDFLGSALPGLPLVQAISSGGQGPIEAFGPDGVSRVYAFARLGTLSSDAAYVTVGISKAAALAEANRLLARNLTVLALVAILALGATRVYGKRFILRPVNALVSATERLSAGDLSARAQLASHDEFGVIAGAFNAMAERLATIVTTEQRRSGEIAERKQMGELLAACTSLKEAYAVIGQYVRRMFPNTSGALYFFGPESSLAEPVVTWGSDLVGKVGTLSVDECWGLRRGRAHVVEDTASGVLCGHLATEAPPAYLCIPLVAHGEALGVLHLTSLARGPDHSAPGPIENTLRLASPVAEDLALTLANLKLRETLSSQSIRDHLTDLFNRRYMEETLDRELRRAARAERPVSVVMLDIDRFKQMNDILGHDGGDAVLRALGRMLQANVRGGDIPCRYGGDEIVIILPEASLADAKKRADQLREAAKRFTTHSSSESLGPVTLSLGVAAFPDHGSTVGALLQKADAALYRAKREGGDRVITAEPIA